MFRTTGVLLAFSLIATTQIHAQSAPIPADAKALAQAMGLAESTRLGIEASLQKAILQGRSTQKELDCVKGSSVDFAADAYATAMASALSADETKQAIAFFSSPEGREYLRYSRSLELKQRGIPDADPKPELTDTETRAAQKFMEKSAGKKLLEDRVLETPEVRAALARGVIALRNKCAG
jgi:hypothetical protein